MTKSLQMTALEHLAARLREQTVDVANLRMALDIQLNRISNMHVDLAVLPGLRKRHKSLRTVTSAS